jgi:hypothetical protein
MIYVDTRREFWRFASTAPRFFGSALVLALASALATPGAPHAVGFVLVAATLLKFAFELGALDPLNAANDHTPLTPALKTARLLAGPLRREFILRLVCGGLGGVLLPLVIATGAAPAAAAWPALGLVILGELAERYLFFRAVVAPKMPGVGHA